MDALQSDLEQKTRRHWLIATCCNFSVDLFLMIPSLVLLWGTSSEGISIRMLTSALGKLIVLGLFLHFAYRKQGTRMLTMWLWLAPIGLIRSMLGSLSLWHEGAAWAIGDAAVSLGLFLWWYPLNFKLRKINKAIRLRASAAQTEPCPGNSS